MDVFTSTIRQGERQAHPIGSYRSDNYAKLSLFLNTRL